MDADEENTMSHMLKQSLEVHCPIELASRLPFNLWLLAPAPDNLDLIVS